jgi:hypothetical protein
MKNGSSTGFGIFLIVSNRLRTIQLFRHITFCPESVITARKMEKFQSPFDLTYLIFCSYLILRFMNTLQLLTDRFHSFVCTVLFYQVIHLKIVPVV